MTKLPGESSFCCTTHATTFLMSHFCHPHVPLCRFVTREAFMRKVMNRQNFARYPYVMELIKEAEALYANIQKMER